MDNNKRQPYGWLAPDGKFIEADWGDHEDCAYEILLDNNWEDNYIDWTQQDKNNFNVGDYICKEKVYVLINNPECEYYHVTNVKPLTKKQKEFLFDYFIAMNMKDRAYYCLNS